MNLKIYQARSGGIMLLLGRCAVPLTLDQVETLPIPLYDLEDFDQLTYQQYYGLAPVTAGGPVRLHEEPKADQH